MLQPAAQQTLDESDGQTLSRVRATRRRCILDSALQTFLRDGYHGATMERVAEDAGVSKQTLYNYFADKDELFVSLVEAHKAEHVLPALDAPLEAIAAGDVEAGVRAAALALLRAAGQPESRALFRMVHELASQAPELTLRVRERIRERVALRSLDQLRAALSRGAAAGHLRPVDCEAAAQIFFGALTAYTLLTPILLGDQQQAMPPERLAAGLADLLCQGLRPAHA